MSLGATLRKLRLRKGESLQDVATAVGASKAHIWELEMGKSTNPSLDLLKKLADHFAISVAVLVGEVPPEEGGDGQLQMLYRGLTEITEEDKELIATLISQMKARKDGGK